MSTQTSVKVRLVRCPKCRLLLAELPEVSLYKCGGCGTILQAKNRKMETPPSELSSEATDINTQRDIVSEVESSNLDSTGSLKRESSPDRDNIGHQKNKNGDMSSSELCCSSSEFTHRGNEDFPVEYQETPKRDLVDPSNHDSEFHDTDGELTGGGNFSDEFPSSSELVYHEKEGSTPESSEHVEKDDKTCLDQSTKVDHSEADNPKFERNPSELSSEGTDSEEKEVESSNIDLITKLETESSPDQEIRREENENVNESRELCYRENGDSPMEVEEKSKHDLGDSPSSQYSKRGDSETEGELTGARNVSYELPSSSELVRHEKEESPSEIIHVEKYDKACLDQFEGDHSIDKSRTLEGGKCKDFQENEEKGGNTSSNLVLGDENLDHSRRKIAQTFESFSSMDTFKTAVPNLEFERGASSNFPTTQSYYGSESSYDGNDEHTPSHISHPSRRKSKDIDTKSLLKNDGFWVESEPESNRWGASSSTSLQSKRNRTRFDNQNFSRNIPFENGLNYRHDLPPPHPNFYCQDNASYSEPNKMDLLRTVYELEDKLNRMQFEAHGRFSPEGKNNPFLYDQLSETEIQWLRFNQARMAFSGDPTRFNRLPQDRPYSAQLPSRPSQGQNGQNRYYYPSTYSSPQHYMSSEISFHEAIREKHHVVKRHVRPFAGGAPVVACYRCSGILQIPADFIVVFKKRYHQLRCGSCNKILKFSLKSTHLVPYVPEASTPPPSEAESAIIRRSSSCQHGESESFFDEYGNSFCRSCSTEREGRGVVESFESVELKKVSSEIEEMPPSKNSPLHRLMGYKSPSQVLKE